MIKKNGENENNKTKQRKISTRVLTPYESIDLGPAGSLRHAVKTTVKTFSGKDKFNDNNTSHRGGLLLNYDF